ncbi:MAG: hypothetical protein RSC26_07225 [Terrisporobacter sp.]
MLKIKMKGEITLHAIINIFGNIIMFIPIGFLIPLLWSKLDPLKKIMLCGFYDRYILS